METKTQCLNCNSTELQTKKVLFDRKSGKKIGLFRNLIWGSFLALLGALLTVAGVGISQEFGIIWLFAVYFVFLGAPLLAYGIELIIRYIKADKANMIEFECKSCNNDWEQWEEGWASTPCQKCGKSHVTKYSSLVDPVKHKPLNWGLNVYGGLCAIVFGLVGTISMITLVIETSRDTPLLEGLGVKLFFIGVAFVPAWLILWGIKAISKYYAGTKSRLFEYFCADCSFEWNQVED